MELNDVTYRGMGPVRVQVINKYLGIYSLIHFFFHYITSQVNLTVHMETMKILRHCDPETAH